MAQIKRETAIICTVTDLLNGSFVRTEGWSPSYFTTDLGDISRVNLVGVIVSKELAGGVLLDDGGGRILLRSFEGDVFGSVDTGDLVIVIGRPRVYNEQKYVLPEIIRKIDPKWGSYRQIQLEILRKKVRITPEKKENRVLIKEDVQPVNYFQKIMEFIRDLDVGAGADIDEVTKRSEAPNADTLIRKLIEEGEIFEIKPGKLKILE
jgi:RPA family protein